MAKDLFTTATGNPKTESLEKRARKRRVKQLNYSTWLVLGSKSLRDARDSYRVIVNSSGRYECECWSMDYGETRRNNCSHVAGVKMARRGDLPYEIVEEKGAVKDSGTGESDGEGRGLSMDREALLGRLRGSYSSPVPEQPDILDNGTDDLERGGEAESSTFPTGTLGSPPAVPGIHDSPLTGIPAPDNIDNVIPLRPVNGDLPLDPPVPQHEMFGQPPIPAKFTEFRDHQWDAIRQLNDGFGDGKKVMFLEAPTGSGKTLIAETVGRLRAKRDRHVYLCTTKSLQEQILGDFDYGDQIKGRANYRTQGSPNANCGDCDGDWTRGLDTCSYCAHRDMCPYVIAKDRAIRSDLPVLNTAYYLGETSGQYSQFAGRPLTIIDECDALEGVLMGWIEVNVTSGLRKKLGVGSIPKKTVTEDWVRWLSEELIPAIDEYKRDKTAQGQLFDDGDDLKRKRELKRLTELKARANGMLDAVEDDGAGAWVMTGYERAKKDEYADLTFKPVRVRDYARELLWDRGDQFLLMSATVISAEQMAYELGLDDDEWGYVSVDSTFPPERRPVMYDPVVSVTHKTKDEAYPKIAAKTWEIIDNNPGKRILVHVVSYHLGKYLYENIGDDRVMTYWNAREREGALKRFHERSDAVMLAPSFERGIDLPGELCEVMVIAKVPYPNLGDKQVNARRFLKGGQRWYAVETIRTVCQMTGRGMRSKDDWCDTYIIDRNFRRLVRENKQFFPDWWVDGLAMSRTDPRGKRLWNAAKERMG